VHARDCAPLLEQVRPQPPQAVTVEDVSISQPSLAVAALQSENPIAQDGLHFDEAQLDSVALFKLQVTPHAPQSATEEPADLPVVRLMQSDEPSHRVRPDSHAVNEPVVVLEEPPPPLPPEEAPASAPGRIICNR
jgi:hypothetical protein